MARHLPREIKLRLADVRRHYEALALALERTSPEQFRNAARASEPEELIRAVYPLERAFEIVCSYVGELAGLGLAEAGLAAGDRSANLRLLEREGVIGHERARRLRAMLAARNELQHEYPDVRAAGTYEAALGLAAELPGFLRDYAGWLRRLGFGEG